MPNSSALLADHLGFPDLGVPYPLRTTSKPRSRGVTMVMDCGWPIDFYRGMLESFGEYVDIVKLWDPHLRTPVDQVEKRIAMYHEFDIAVQPGGLFLESARHGHRVNDLLPRLRELGFDAVEISSSTGVRTTMEHEAELVSVAKDCGFRIIGEVGAKFWSGDATRLTYDTIDVDRTVDEFKELISAGAEVVYWEGHLLRAVMGDDPVTLQERASYGTQQVLQVVDAVGLDHIAFEASGLRPIENRQWLQFWLVRLFGPEVGIANARIEELAHLEAIRSGSHPIFGFENAGNYPWLRAWSSGRDDWWRC